MDNQGQMGLIFTYLVSNNSHYLCQNLLILVYFSCLLVILSAIAYLVLSLPSLGKIHCYAKRTDSRSDGEYFPYY